MKVNFKKILSLVLVLALCCFVLASCGNKSAEESESEEIPSIDLELPNSSDEDVTSESSSEEVTGDETNPDESTEETEITSETETTSEEEATSGTETTSDTEADPATSEAKQTAVTKTNLNLRSTPSTDGERITTLSEGTTLEVLDASDPEWIKVSYNGGEGYVKSEFVELSEVPATSETTSETETTSEADSEATSETESATAQKKGKVTTETLNVRSTPSTDGEKVGTLQRNDAITILEETDGWYKIEINNTTGYVSADYVVVSSN